VHTGFGWGKLRKRDHLEDPGTDGRIILNGSPRSWMGGWVMEWTDLAQDRERWQAVMKTEMKPQVP